MTFPRNTKAIPVLMLALVVGLAWATPTDSDYERGREALDRQDFRDAKRAFEDSIDSGGDQADAANYWLASTLARMNRTDEALARLVRFQEERPDSRWADDARKLHAELSGGSDPGTSDEDEIRLIALQALATVDGKRAVELLEKLMMETDSPSLKEEALFVMLHSGAPEARGVALGLAQSSDDPDLQIAAIHSLAMFGDSAEIDLARLYETAENAAVKRAVLESYMIRNDKKSLVEIARNERDERLQSEAIEYLAVMGAIKELEEIFGGSSSPKIQARLLEAYMISGHTAPVLEIARGDGPIELRRQAVEMLGVMGENDAVIEIYRGSSDAELRQAAIEAIAISGDGDFLREIVRTEKSAAIRAQAVMALAYTGEGQADELVKIYRESDDPELRQAALEGLMIQGSVDQLIELARAEKDPRIKKQIVEILAVTGSEKAVAYLMELIDG